MTTNEDHFNALFSELHPLEMALLRERIINMVELNRDSIKEDPGAFRTALTSEHTYLGLMDKIERHLGFPDSKEVKSVEEGVKLVNIEEVKKGEYFRLPGKKVVYVRGEYNRSIDKYEAHKFEDICEFRQFKNGTSVEIGFTF
jgi:hypothetical protein